MGSFNTSCLITGDLIQDGDRIVAIILERQKDSFKRSYSNGSQDGYRIASFAIRGAYDSYGRCSDDSSENSKLKILNEIFKTDIFNNFLFIQTGMWDRKLGLNFNVFKYLTDKGIDNNQDANLQINFIHEDTYDLMIKMMRKNTDLDYDKKETYESFINNTFDEIENRILFINSKKNHKKYKESISIFNSFESLLYGSTELNIPELDINNSNINNILSFDYSKGFKHSIGGYYLKKLHDQKDPEFSSKEYLDFRKNLIEFLIFNTAIEKANIYLRPLLNRGQTYEEDFKFQFKINSQILSNKRHLEELKDSNSHSGVSQKYKVAAALQYLNEANIQNEAIQLEHKISKNNKTNSKIKV